ncbi:hypothetical protein F5Y04DRAFT_250556 [Hypomontagnella monticulosa]|nr:hypothetical protein F5Y04DRAFT_250556 [Hypomontagnella monticulosa]
MKPQSFLLPALAGIVTASVEEKFQDAEAYILGQPKTINPPSIPNKLARAILLQRLSTPEQPSILGQLPESLAKESSIHYINKFGKPARPLFEDENDVDEPNQLVIALSGMTTEKYDNFKTAMSSAPLAFTAPRLFQLPVQGKKSNCAFEQSIDYKNDECWEGKTQYLEYDVSQEENIIWRLENNLEILSAQAQSGKLATTIVLLAPYTQSDELHRRELEDDETVMVDEDDLVDIDIATGDTTFNPAYDAESKPFHAFADPSRRPPAILPSCFASVNACVSATNDCSGHGQCINRWEKIDTKKTCYFCHCMSTNETVGENRTGVYHWGGSACHKQDISTPFWLFAGVTIALVSTIAFSIGLLFSVGEEKLPGVIGAGVSRSK